jgi:hypothetical protein
MATDTTADALFAAILADPSDHFLKEVYADIAKLKAQVSALKAARARRRRKK